jgi:Archaeal phage integrase
MGDCHSFDPGSKFGLEKKPNGHPGPGAYTFYGISNSSFKNLQQNQTNRDSPPSQTGLYNTRQSQLNSCTLHSEKDNTAASPLVENGFSRLVENRGMNSGNDKNLLLLAATTTKGSEIDDGFKQYLLAQRKRNLKQILLKAAKHGHILETGDASEILTFSNTKRRHVMEALVCLSKYQGTYNTWKEIKEKYQLKWTSPDSLEVFQSIFNNEKNYSSMLSWLKNVIAQIPKPYANILIYNTLTGLRPAEACQSIALIQGDFQNYLKKDKMVLEHYRYPEIYIRNSKKAFISIVDDTIIKIGREAANCGYNALRNYLVRRKLGMNMSYCRKIFATHLRTKGVEQETIDLLQGRIPKSVFARHYFRPDFENVQNKIRKSLNTLQNEIGA